MKEPELWLGIIVAVVFLSGFVIFAGANSITGHVTADPCDCTPGEPVCGALNSEIEDYPSACHAVCAGARIVFEDRCTNIPKK